MTLDQTLPSTAATAPGAPVAPAASAPPGTLGTAELADLVRSIAARPERWRPLVRFQQSGRWWTRLDAPAGVDVWLLTWLPAQGTELHDHGRSSAAFTVTAGTLTELRPDDDDGTPVPQGFATGRTQTVEPGDLHDVVNAGTEPAVSIHAYSPPLTRMTYWGAGPDGVLVPTRTVDTDEPETDA
ncbi:cysteine dioxygenase [Cellulomonas septica]|uniref:Cysteine dioxygenase n=1 Tax=Cellulomonas septica TaxID=285080 RepID=A0ABX1K0D0_9CELL|nr:cysteine dioxygenase family protein [Cellulomonas septica]NKY39450.1 cysteine dioxygenase [Cellulomonas septica]